MLYFLSRKAGIRYKGDERILGDSEFVERVLKADEERLERRYALQAKRYDFDAVIVQVAKHWTWILALFYVVARILRRSKPEVCFATGPIGNCE
jgi:hypothetical protein